MITIWLSALTLVAVTYLLMWRKPTRTKLYVVAVVLVIPLALTLWTVVVGDQMPEGGILVQPAPKASP